MSEVPEPPLDSILETASRLGEAMKAHPRFLQLRAAEKAVLENPEAVLLAEGLGRARREVADCAAKGDPAALAAAEQRADRLARAAAGDPLLRELARAQTRFQEMVDRVSRTMLDVMAP